MVASKREAEVLALIGAHLTNAEIAGRLHLSVRTVETHVSSLLRKYGVADRRALAELAGQAETDHRMVGIPTTLTRFIGRQADSERLVEVLRNARLVTLVGPGGVGKTRLAAMVARNAEHGGAFIDLVPVRSGYLAQSVAAALGVTERPQQPLVDAIIERLADGRWLLVLDNCEHVIDMVAEFAERLLLVCPGTRILVTSRERLGVPGEQIVHLAPLPLDSDAELLFMDRAGPGFAAEPAFVTELCGRLDGMPLAIELAAARSATLGPGGLSTALEDQLRLLAGGRGADERHRSLRAVMAWSHNLLDEEERALFRRLAVFAGGFDLDAAIAVTPDGNRSAVADVLGRLADKSLAFLSGGRWRLLETIRAFAMEQLEASGEGKEISRRHLIWAASTAVQLEARLDGDWRADFDAVADDLRAALTAASSGPDADAHRLARALGHLTYARRFLMEALGHYQHAADLAPDPAMAAADLRDAADCTHSVGDAGSQPFELLLASAERAGEAGDRCAQACALAWAVVTASRHPSAFADEVPHGHLLFLLGEAVAAGDKDDAVVAAHLAAAAAWTADPIKGRPDPELAEAALTAARATGDPVLITTALDAVTYTASASGRHRDALRIVGERLALIPELPRHLPYAGPEIVDTFRMASQTGVGSGDLRFALSAARQSVADDLVGSSYASAAHLITPLVLAGRFDEALSLASAAWEGWERAGRPFGSQLSAPLASIALVHGLRGDERRFALWRSRAPQPVRLPRMHSMFATFVDARLIVHTGQFTGADALVDAAFAASPGWSWTYAHAAAAELAVVAGLKEAEHRLREAAVAGDQNDWAAACLARAKGRMYGDAAALADSVERWERIDSRFERACTLLLIPEREEEGRIALTGLGVISR